MSHVLTCQLAGHFVELCHVCMNAGRAPFDKGEVLYVLRQRCSGSPLLLLEAFDGRRLLCMRRHFRVVPDGARLRTKCVKTRERRG